jgi:hypothetical protein
MRRAWLAGAVVTGLAVTGTVVAGAEGTADAATARIPLPPWGSGEPTIATATGTTMGGSGMPRQLVVPDLIAAMPAGLTPAQVSRIRKLVGVRAVLAVSGGQIRVNGQPATVLGGDTAAVRSWTPPATAADSALWTSFGRGELVTSPTAAKRLGLRSGAAYPVSAAISAQVRAGSAARLGVPGIDAIVNARLAARLGLIKNVAVLINAPGANLVTLTKAVSAVLGTRGQVVRLVPVNVSEKLPVDSKVSGGRPTSYQQLYQESAALYCPGLSWTVLAAIGEIESGNGTNVGPSSAGALGPMQFMPATWAEWGIDAFGETGTPNVMDPLDAVPSAARMLCADGAGKGGASLSRAIYDYNHATWYVTEVLDLAAEYARP